MIALLLYRTLADHVVPWAATFATRLLARGLDMPEPLVHSTGDYIVARVVAFETGLGKRLCPFRFARMFRARWHA